MVSLGGCLRSKVEKKKKERKKANLESDKFDHIRFLLVQISRKKRPRGKKDRSRAVRDSIIPRQPLADRRKHRAAPLDPVRGFSCKKIVIFLIRVHFKPLGR